MTARNDQLISDYLEAVRRAAADLPREQQEELIADLREHIATARGELQPETEAGVRSILDRLGEPASIAAEARQGRPPVLAPPRSTGTRTVLLILAAVIGIPIVVCLLGAALLYAFLAVSPESNQVPSTVVSTEGR
jgi:uncharacterized membrane protein